MCNASWWKMLSLVDGLAFWEDGVQQHPSLDDIAFFMRKCRTSKDLVSAQRRHAQLCKIGLEERAIVGNHLIEILVDVGNMLEAQQVFDGLSQRSERSWNSLIVGYTKYGKPELALDLSRKMIKDASVQPNGHTFVSILKACAKLKDLEVGVDVHSKVAEMGLLQNDLFVGTSLVDMYIKCGLRLSAQQVFDKLPIRNVVSWTTLIAGYADCGHGDEALECFDQMQLEGVFPDVVTFICSLKACRIIKDVNKGREIHTEIERQDLLKTDLSLGNSLVDMYAKCGSMSLAQEVFDKLAVRDLVSWTALIAGYAETVHGAKALKCLKQLQDDGLSPDIATFVCSLKACGSIKDLEMGFAIHTEIEKHGLLGKDVVVGNSLVDMYTKCDQLVVAQRVFVKLSIRNVVSWNAIIEGYAEHGCGKKALELYEQMQLEGVPADTVTFLSSLKACRSTGAMETAREIHAEVERQGSLEKSLSIGNMFVDLYATTGSLAKAQQVFERLPTQDLVSWNALIEGYADHGYSEEALECFAVMQSKGIPPDAITHVCILKACGNIGLIEKGEEVHIEIERQGLLDRNLVVGNALLDMYSNCGLMAKAQHVFDRFQVRDVVSWNILITGYAEHGPSEEAINCFENMERAGVIPDIVSFVCSLKACGDRGAAAKGESIHCEIERQGLLERDLFVGSALVDMYAKCGSLSKAQQVFDKIPVKNVVPWNALMSGYAQIGESECVFCTFDRMLGEKMKPTFITFVVVLSACSRAGLFCRSQLYFEAMSKTYGIIPTSEHQTCLVDAFCRAGELHKAVAMITKLPSSPDLEVWHSVLGACKHWGNLQFGEQAFEHCVQIDRNNTAAYVLMSHIYAVATLKEY